MTNQLVSVCDAIPFIQFNVQLKLHDEVNLGKTPGSTLHGGLGWALKEVGGTYYQALMARIDQKGNALPAQCFIKLNRSTKQTLNFTISLISDAVTYAPQLLQAIIHWQYLGVGEQRTKFELVQIKQQLQNQWFDIYQQASELALKIGPPDQLSSLLHHPIAQSGQQLRILVNTNSLFSIKPEGKLLTAPPTLQQFLASIAHRLSLLNSEENQKITIPAYALQQAINSKWQPRAMHRNSSRQGRGSLLGHQGQWHYKINAEDYAWFKLAELIQIGKKTTFGFGDVSCIPAIIAPCQ